MLIEGVVPALVTPFLPGGKGVDVSAVKPMVDFLLKSGVNGFYVCGNTGEGFYQSVEERKVMAEAVMDALKSVEKRVPVIIMVTAATLELSIELAKHAKEIGADAISSVVPVDRPKELAAALGFWKVLGAATDLPFYIYWISATADKSVTPANFVAAVEQIPTFAGIKFTDTNFFLFEQLMTISGRMNAVTGPDEMMVAGLAMGSHGAIGSTYNVHPRLACRLYEHFRKNENSAALECQKRINRLIATLFQVCRCSENQMNLLSGLKVIYRRIHGINVGPCHANSNISNLTPEQEEELVSAISGPEYTVE